MGIAKRLKEWNAASAAFEQQRNAELADAPLLGGGAVGEARVVAAVVKVVALLVAVIGAACGVALGRALVGWSRPFGLAVPGWIVILAAVATATLLYAVGAGLACLDQIRRTNGR